MVEILQEKMLEIGPYERSKFSGRSDVEFWASKRLKFLGEAIKNFWQAAKRKDRLFEKNYKTS